MFSGFTFARYFGVFGDLARDLTEHRSDFTFEVTDAGLTRVVVDDRADRGIADLDLRLP